MRLLLLPYSPFLPTHVGNGVAHSPDGRQIDSDGPRIPKPSLHENAARPPTSRDNTATRGCDRFDDAVSGRSPHSTPVTSKHNARYMRYIFYTYSRKREAVHSSFRLANTLIQKLQLASSHWRTTVELECLAWCRLYSALGHDVVVFLDSPHL